MSDDLYGGRPGVALFLASLEHITGGTGFRELAMSAILPLPTCCDRNCLGLLAYGIGAATGLGGQPTLSSELVAG